jgi:hypothetical protein
MFDVSFSYQGRPYQFSIREALETIEEDRSSVVYRVYDPSGSHFLFSIYPGTSTGPIHWDVFENSPGAPLPDLVEAVGKAIERRNF